LAQVEAQALLEMLQSFLLSLQPVAVLVDQAAMVALVVQVVALDTILLLAVLHLHQDKATLVVHQTLGQAAVAVLVLLVLQVLAVIQAVKVVTV
jgi:hypothetical protein